MRLWALLVLLLCAKACAERNDDPPPLPASLVWFEDWESGGYERWTGTGYARNWSDCTISGRSDERAVSPPFSHRSRIFCPDDASHRGYGGLRFEGTQLVPSYRTDSGGGLDARHGVVSTFWAWLDASHPFTPTRWMSLLTVTDDCSNQWKRVVTLNLADATGRLLPVHVDSVRYAPAAPAFPRRIWTRVTVYLNGYDGVMHVWQDGRPVVEATFERPSPTFCQWHFGLYASGSCRGVELFEDDLSIWTLNQPWMDFSVEPRFGAPGRFPARPPAIAEPVDAPRSAPSPVPPPATPSVAEESPTAEADPHAIGPPRPVITLAAGGGPAPCTIFAHALETELGAGDPLTARYLWDFGDAGAPYDRLEGFNAAHVYERPGTYQVTLTLVNEAGRAASATAVVTIEDDDRRPIYVSAEGHDRADGRTPQSAVRTLARAARRLGDGGAILLRRGDTFDVETSLRLARRGWRLGAWGDGQRPVVRWRGPLGRSAILVLDEARTADALIEDVRFDSVHAAFPGRNIVDAIRAGGARITVRNCAFGHVSTAVNTEHRPAGVLTLGNEARERSSVRAYFVWGEGTDHVHLGNTINGSRHEHVMRFAGAERVLVTGNHLTNDEKRTIWVMRGRHAAIIGNDLHEGRLTVGPNHAAGTPEERQLWTVIARNHLDRDAAPTPSVEIEAGAEHVSVRNNIIRAPGNGMIRIMAHLPSMQRSARDVRILSNTAVCTGSGRFLDVGSDARGLLVCNNLFVAPELATGKDRTAIIFVLDDDLAGFQAIAHNCWPVPREFHWVDDGYHYVWSSWSHAEGYRNPDEWSSFPQTQRDVYADVPLEDGSRPPAWSSAVGHARPVPGVHVDFTGRPRPADGRWTAGAVEVRGFELSRGAGDP